MGKQINPPINTLKKTITEGEISSTATFKNRYGIPQIKPSSRKRPQPALVNYLSLPSIKLIFSAISEYSNSASSVTPLKLNKPCIWPLYSL